MHKMLIPQVHPWLGTEEAEAAAASILSNWITEGPRCDEFSERLNHLIEVPYGVFTPNGTLALILGLMALNIQAGDEVLVPDISFIASANAVIHLGAIPIFIEVEPLTFQIDVNKAENLVTTRTKAIMPVHLYGTSCNMSAVKNFASKYNLKIIEDAAQGIGVKYYDQHVGGIGDVGCFSFFADKTITTGEGGYVVCRDEAIYDRLRYLRNQGRLNRGSFKHPMIGYNYRITDIHAAIGLIQLKKLKLIIERKTEIMFQYADLLKDVPEVTILGKEPGSTHIPFRCVLMAKSAHDLMRFLEENGISTRTFFYPLHQQTCFNTSSLKHDNNSFFVNDLYFQNSVYGYQHGICLPIFPTMSQEQVFYICDKIKQFYVSIVTCHSSNKVFSC